MLVSLHLENMIVILLDLGRGCAKQTKRESNDIKRLEKLLSYQKSQVRVIGKAIGTGKVVPKEWFKWVVEAKEIENHGQDLLAKLDQNGEHLSVVDGKDLSSMQNIVIEQLKRCPFQQDHIYNSLANLTLEKNDLVTKRTLKESFNENKTLDAHIKISQLKSAFGLEGRASSSRRTQAEESIKGRPKQDKDCSKGVFTSPPMDESTSGLKNEETENVSKSCRFKPLQLESDSISGEPVEWISSSGSPSRETEEAVSKEPAALPSNEMQTNYSVSVEPERKMKSSVTQKSEIANTTNDNLKTNSEISNTQVESNRTVDHVLSITTVEGGMVNFFPVLDPSNIPTTFQEPLSSYFQLEESGYTASVSSDKARSTGVSLFDDLLLSYLKQKLKYLSPENEPDQRKEIISADNEIDFIHDKSKSNDLKFQCLKYHRRLRTVPDSLFESLPQIEFLDLSKTGIRSLPSSLFKCSKLKALLLRECDNLEELPPEIKDLQAIEVIDLRGTHLYNLPDEIAKLNRLSLLRVNFYGVDEYDEIIDLPRVLVSNLIISKLVNLTALSIVVHPGDPRWSSAAKDITRDVSQLSRLDYLDFYFPEVNYLKLFMEKSPSWREGRLRKFRFVVGQDFKRIVSRVPEEIVQKHEANERCLRYVNSNRVPTVLAKILRNVTAFHLDHHYEIKNVTEFGLKNLIKLRFFIISECTKIEGFSHGKEREIVFPFLQHLSIHHLWSLKSIWNDTVPNGSFRELRFFMVSSCPKLKFVVSESMLYNLSNLEELIVEDCESVEVIIKTEKRLSTDVKVLPSLKKIELRFLPKLVSLGDGVHMFPQIIAHGCPNFS